MENHVEHALKYQWVEVAREAVFAPRDGAGLLSFNDRLWLLGGWNPADKVRFPRICNSEVWSSADGAEWKLECAAAPWEGRHTAGWVVHRGRMWIVGGDANQGHYQNDVWSSADGVNWQLETSDAPWGPRVLHHVVSFQDQLWLIGGQTIPSIARGPERFYGDVWRSADGKKWERVLDRASWAPRCAIGGNAVLHGKMWLIGGGTYDTPARPMRVYHHDVWSSGNGVIWDLVTGSAPWFPRMYQEIAAFDERLWVLEGYHQDGGNRNDVWSSSDGLNWQELPATPWAPRHAASVCVHDGALWLVAGNNMNSDVWKLIKT